MNSPNSQPPRSKKSVLDRQIIRLRHRLDDLTQGFHESVEASLSTLSHAHECLLTNEERNRELAERAELQSENNSLRGELRDLEAQLQEQQKAFDDFRSHQPSIDSNSSQVAELESENDELLGTNERLSNELDDLRRQADQWKEQAQQAVAAKEKAELACEESVKALDSEREQRLAASDCDQAEHANQIELGVREATEALQAEIEQLQSQINFLSEELDAARKVTVPPEEDWQSQIDELRAQLLDSRRETVELRMQNSDLADQLATSSIENSSNSAPEAISWEERKRRLLAQLEAEDDTDEDRTEDRLEIQDILDRTSSEIDRRDREIEELRRLVDEQSNAHHGIAVGAAAIAQLVDSDELIAEEREKIQQLQKDWEDKLRSAEIEFSRERAKLARERLELEEKCRNFEEKSNEQESSDTEPDSNKRGRWLARLGIRNEE